MKKYYACYSDFINAYCLAWAETPAQTAYAKSQGYKRVTRRKAEKLCAAENRRRKDNPAFGGYASSVIYPVDFDPTYMYERNDLTQTGYVMEYRTAQAAEKAAAILANRDKYTY